MYTQYITILTLCLYAFSVFAGSTEPPAPPDNSNSASYTLEDLYQRLDKGTPGEKRTGGFVGPSAGPDNESTWMHTVDEIMSIAPEIQDNAAQPSDIAAGKTYWGLSAAGWGPQTGIKINSSCFVDNGDGTVTDTRTGLIWLKNANCSDISPSTWNEAEQQINSEIEGLKHGDCGLTDSSQAGDWRLPEVWELQSLVDYSEYVPALPVGHPFTSVQSSNYWSATTGTSNSSNAWSVYLGYGGVNPSGKTNTGYVWPVLVL